MQILLLKFKLFINQKLNNRIFLNINNSYFKILKLMKLKSFKKHFLSVRNFFNKNFITSRSVLYHTGIDFKSIHTRFRSITCRSVSIKSTFYCIINLVVVIKYFTKL